MNNSTSVKTLTEKEVFLKYLEEMDIEMLELILDDSINYFGASKKIFLEKLAYIFNQFKLAGGTGFLKTKQHKRYKNTYYLLIPIFYHSIKFIIEEKNNRIVRIYKTKVIMTSDDVDKIGPFDLFFGDDEKAGFKASNEYVMTLYNCTNAYQEIINKEKQVLTRIDISIWLNKYHSHYVEVKDKHLLFRFKAFRDLYFLFQYIEEQLNQFKEVNRALESFCGSNSTLLYQWLSQYDRLAFCEVLGFESNFTEINMAEKTLKHDFYSNIYFKGDDFLSIVQFNKIFHENYDRYYGRIPMDKNLPTYI